MVMDIVMLWLVLTYLIMVNLMKERLSLIMVLHPAYLLFLAGQMKVIRMELGLVLVYQLQETLMGMDIVILLLEQRIIQMVKILKELFLFIMVLHPVYQQHPT